MTRKAGLGRENIYQDSKRLATLIAASSGAAGPHNVLSATHTDAATTAATRGDLIVADDTPQWDVLAIGGANTYLKSDGTDPAWATVAMGEVTGGDAQFVTLAVSAGLANERVLTAGEGVTLTDAGAGSTITASLTWGTPTIGTIECDDAAAAGTSTNPARSDHQHAIVCAAPGADSVNVAASAEGSAASFARSDHAHNLDENIAPTWTGLHTFNADITIGAGVGIIHTDGVTDGQVLVADGTRYIPGDISDITGGDAQYVVMTANATLANERVLTAGDGISLADAGAGGAATLGVDLVDAWSGLEFSGGDLRVDLDAAFTWTAKHTFTSTDGIELNIASGDPIIIFDCAGANRFTLGVDDSDSDKFKINSGSTLANPSDLELDSSGNVEIGGDLNLLTGKGIIHADGVTDGQVLVANGTRYVPGNLSDITGGAAQFVVMTADGTLANERVLTAGDGLARADGGAGSTVTLTVDVTDILGSGLTESANNIDLAWGTPTIGTIECDDAASAGTSTNPARSDHQHAIVCAAAGTISPDDSAAEGSAASFSRSDHTHGITCAAPVANLSVSSTDAEGDASSFARSNHTHAIDSSSAPGAAAYLLATDASGFVTVVQATASSKIYINESANGDITTGLTINQGGADDHILAFKSSDVAHGITDAAETDTFGYFKKHEADAGGLQISGLKDTNGVSLAAVEIVGYLSDAANDAKDDGAIGIIDLRAAITDGDTDVTAVAAAGNLASIRNDTDTVFIFGADMTIYTVGGGGLLINESENTLNTVGITINQGANDDEAFAVKSSDVAHGASGVAETDTFFSIRKAEALSGGAQLRGMKDDRGSPWAAMSVKGYLAENPPTTKSTDYRGIVTVEGYQTSGASVTNTVADGIVFSVATYRGGAVVALMHVDEDGDIAVDGAVGAYDAEDDVALIRELSEVLAQPRGQVAAFTATERPRSAELGIITTGEHGVMVSTKRHTAVLRGAILQLEERLRRLEARA